MRNTLQPYCAFNAKLRANKLLRHLCNSTTYPLDFSTNDYLGLSKHPALIQTAQDAACEYGVGNKASRLVMSDQKQIRALEALIASTKQSQSALVFNSGYQANISVLSALLDSSVLGSSPLVYSDRLNHASMHAGCQLAKVKQLRYHHLDYDHLAFLLAQNKNSKRPQFILTESVFGMDGDVACLETIIRLAKQYDAFIYVDEAHATGLFGSKGYGLTQDYAKDIDLTMGTFSKGLGNSGAYVSCNKALKRFLINKSQGFIFSTAPSPVQIAVMQASWELIPSLQIKAQQLQIQAQDLRLNLKEMGYDIANSTTHIIPIILKTPEKTMRAQKWLAQNGIRVSAIRSPSVPLNQCRLRIALSAYHTIDAINILMNSLQKMIHNAF